jgi:hypothetical protein
VIAASVLVKSAPAANASLARAIRASAAPASVINNRHLSGNFLTASFSGMTRFFFGGKAVEPRISRIFWEFEGMDEMAALG